jgi:hypothetical protein
MPIATVAQTPVMRGNLEPRSFVVAPGSERFFHPSQISLKTHM